MSSHNTILIVEDEILIAKDLKQLLVKIGYDVLDILSTGKQAIKFSAKNLPDLVIMDIHLEGKMDGIEAAGIITEKHKIPIIYLTANADKTTLTKAAQTNPYGYIIKPFMEIELKAVLEIAFHKIQYDLELQKSEEKFRNLIDDNRDGMVVVNHKGIVLFANKAVEALMERKKDDLIDQNFGFPITSKQLIELEIQTKSKRKKIVEMHTVKTEWDKEKAFLASLRDISRRKKMELQLMESNKKLKSLVQEIISGFVSTVEMRDPYTSGHQKRVAKLAAAIGKELELSQDTIDGLRFAAQIHDIGKIRIPSEILNKPAILSDVEYELIKSHPEDGFEILKNIDFPWPIARIILQHHERIDGSSYPFGLKDDKIMLEAKIICVSDVVEAISAHRPYRPAYSIETALAEIAKFRGIHYDDKIVDACSNLFMNKGFTLESVN
ncbi:MAG: response regulator [Candidatus Cloacimonetes bacterium]|nr:response regulator [Candidatus Cloacimonadota bacterium]